jgi:hypothetical protein
VRLLSLKRAPHGDFSFDNGLDDLSLELSARAGVTERSA